MCQEFLVIQSKVLAPFTIGAQLITRAHSDITVIIPLTSRAELIIRLTSGAEFVVLIVAVRAVWGAVAQVRYGYADLAAGAQERLRRAAAAC